VQLQIAGAGGEFPLGLDALPRKDDGHVGLHDSGLFSRDQRQRVAQILLVIVVDRRDHGEHGLHDVGRIEPAAESDFADQRVDGRVVKEQKSHRGDGLEVGRMRIQDARLDQLFGDFMNTFKCFDKLAVGDGGAIDTNALSRFDEVRRRI
jgi:hypothetical protein